MSRWPERCIPLAALLVMGASLAHSQEAPPAVTVRLEVHNGPQADRYEALSRAPRCQIRGAEGDTLVVAFRPNFPSAITWFALVVPNPYDATRGTDVFRFELTLVSLRLGRVRYTIETRADRHVRGSGAVTLGFTDGRTTAQFAVRSDGIDISGSIACVGVG